LTERNRFKLHTGKTSLLAARIALSLYAIFEIDSPF